MPTPISAKLMLDSEKGLPFVISGPNDTTPQSLAVADFADEVSAVRAARIAAFNLSPIVVAPSRENSTAYTADHATVLSRADGTQVLVTGSGNTAAAEPSGLIDGRPLVDGTATVYSLGMKKTSSDIDAPTITQNVTSANITAAGLTLFDFAVNSAPLIAVSSADAMLGNRTNAYVESVAFSHGAANGNSGVTNMVSPPVVLPPNGSGIGYVTNCVEYDVMVEDHKFAVVGGPFGWQGYVLIDGKLATPNYVTAAGVNGGGVIFDFGGVSKRRRVSIGTFGSAGPNIAGISITPQGKVTAVERNGDVMLVLGDSFNSTVAPNQAPHLGFFLKRYLGLDGLVLANVGGSGYIVKIANTLNIGEVLDAAPNRLLWPYYNPRHILINAGGNDGGQASANVKAAAKAAWALARSIFPTAKITITDGNSGAAGPSANSMAIAVALAEAFQEWGDSNSRFIPIVSGSASTAWVTGTSHAGQALAAGNSSLWTSTDATHPSPGGARYLARRLADEMVRVWGGKY